MKVRTPYNRHPRISMPLSVGRSMCIQVDTSVESLINESDNLSNVKENQGLYYDEDLPALLFAKPVTEVVFDPVQAHFLRQSNQSPDVNTDFNVAKAAVSLSNAESVNNE